MAEPGDYFEYRAGPYSVLIVRGDDGELRAFQNVCRHRGNSICQGSGEGLTQIRCPWHRWTWDLRGQLREVPSRKWFGGLVNDDFPLFPVSVGAWARIVFVNLDPDAPPLLEYLEGIPDDTAWADLDEFRCAAVTHTMVDCNWKVIADGFGETYHVQGIHPEMLGSMDDINTKQRLWDHHGVSYQQYGVPSPRLGRDATRSGGVGLVPRNARRAHGARLRVGESGAAGARRADDARRDRAEHPQPPRHASAPISRASRASRC